MKTYFILIVLAIFGNTTLKAQMAGDFVIAMFDASNTVYYARVTAVENDIITANFVHSNSVYKFTKGEKFKRLNFESDLANNYKGEVKSNVGGKFGSGSAIYYSVASPTNPITESEKCNNELAILEFNDGKKFIAYSKILDQNTYEFQIMHSEKTYKIDLNTKKILFSDGTYKAGGFLKSMYCTSYRAEKRKNNQE